MKVVTNKISHVVTFVFKQYLSFSRVQKKCKLVYRQHSDFEGQDHSQHAPAPKFKKKNYVVT